MLNDLTQTSMKVLGWNEYYACYASENSFKANPALNMKYINLDFLYIQLNLRSLYLPVICLKSHLFPQDKDTKSNMKSWKLHSGTLWGKTTFTFI